MKKHKNKSKIIVTAKLKYPFEFYVAILSVVFTLVVILKQILNDKIQIEWWLLLIGCSIALYGLILIGKQRYKRLVIYTNRFRDYSGLFKTNNN